MNKLLKDILLNQKHILDYLDEQGVTLDFYGGTSLAETDNSTVNKRKESHYTLKLSNNSTIHSYSGQTFWNTVKNVEEKFNYKLFD